jgi:hypothetical protein
MQPSRDDRVSEAVIVVAGTLGGIISCAIATADVLEQMAAVRGRIVLFALT